MRDASYRGDTYCDQSYATKIERREEIRQDLWNAQTFALSEALR